MCLHFLECCRRLEMQIERRFFFVQMFVEHEMNIPHVKLFTTHIVRRLLDRQR